MALLSAVWAITTAGNQSGIAVAPDSQKLRRIKYGIAVALAVVCYGCRAYPPKIKMSAADGRHCWAPPLDATLLGVDNTIIAFSLSEEGLQYSCTGIYTQNFTLT